MNKGFSAVERTNLLSGDFKESQDVGLDYLLKFNVDRLLAPCFEVQGLDTPHGVYRYQGWEGKGVHNWGDDRFTLAGHSLGHWLSAVAITHKSAGSSELKARLDYAVSQLARLQRLTGSGYIGGIKEDTFKKLFSGQVESWAEGYWVPWYGVHKIYQGLIDTYKYTANEQALEVVCKFADWAKQGTNKLTDQEMQIMLDVEHGGMNDVLAQLYAFTNDEDYLKLARRFTHDKILSPLAQQKDKLTGLHANTQIPKVTGAAEIFTRDNSYEYYKNAAQFFWETVVKERTYVIGGNSIDEHFEDPGSETLGLKTCESCNTHNMLKLTEHLFAWNHDSKYMDFYERALYNHILGSQDPDSGNKMYFISTLPGHYRIYGTADESFWCCTGTGMENPGRYNKCIYYEEGSSLYVNLYISSELNWEDRGLKLKQESNLPYSEKVVIKITEGHGQADIKLRVPSWVEGEVIAKVNDRIIYTQSEAGYLTISNNWAEGDEIGLKLPLQLQKYVARDNDKKIAFVYGPIVLAAALGREGFPQTDTYISEIDLDTTTTEVPYLIAESQEIEQELELLDPETLTYQLSGEFTSNNEKLELKPFYKIHHEFYNLYWYLNEQKGEFEN